MMHTRLITFALGMAVALTVGCGGGSDEQAAGTAGGATAGEMPAANPLRNAYFGETHIHTSWSLDAFANNVRTVPDDAYRYAKGEAIDHVRGTPIQLKYGPLDFMALTEHSEYMGIAMKAADPTSPVSETDIGQGLVSSDPAVSSQTFVRLVASAAQATPLPELVDPAVQRSLWQELIDTAERHNDPGRFTTFIAYEWSSIPNFSNLHRNVIFRGSQVPAVPFSLFDSERPEDLWTYMEQARQTGSDVLAIPHNGNVSNGLMYQLTNSDGDPIDTEYSRRRMENEPLNEVIQVKGQSETHPALSPNDEWADFEMYTTKIGSTEQADYRNGYAREAYLNGLLLEERGQGNPYKFGMIGASDIHNSATSVEEDNYTGKIGTEDGTPETRLDPDSEAALPVLDMSAAGLAGVWAEENTRESIFDAMKRKETFATSGPRMRVRFFGGWGFTGDDAAAADMVQRGYDSGVPMGGDLMSRPADGGAPTFMLWATRDPNSAPLQRLQIIKGWVEGGETREQVIDVACSDGGTPSNGRCPDNGATIDITTCQVPQDTGAAELSTFWTDPDFDATQAAFYYVRVLENPVCRWSTWDANSLGVDPPADKDATIQERALSSPIWYRPAGGSQ